MSEDQQQLHQTLWNIANDLRGNMDADDFRDYILGFIFYKYLSKKMSLHANVILKPDGLEYHEVIGHESEDILLQEIKLDAIQDEFEKFWQQEKVMALSKICEEEHLDKKQFNSLIESYVYNGQEPIRQDVFKCLDNRPSILKAREIGERIIVKMKKYVDVFIEGMVG